MSDTFLQMRLVLCEIVVCDDRTNNVINDAKMNPTHTMIDLFLRTRNHEKFFTKLLSSGR